MKIIRLPETRCTDANRKTQKRIDMLLLVIEELNKKEFPVETVREVNDTISTLLEMNPQEKKYAKAIYKVTTKVLEIVREKHQIVSKNYYRNYWAPLGLCVFGLPLGVVLGSFSSMALMGTMLPVGLVIGMLYGSTLDKKAANEGRVLDVEVEI